MSDPEPPGGEPTISHPDHVETRDLRSGSERSARGTRPDSGNQVIQPPRSEGEPRIKIGRYQLLELVGTGGMGMVWGAWDPELERRVALKLVRYSSQHSRERMLREGQVLAKLSHPNVVPVFDVGVAGDEVYLVMEWIRGRTLRAYVEGAVDRRAVLAVYRQAGEGLAAAHDAGVIHRDFKPDNAIVGDDGRVRVLDFGIADHDASAPQATTSGTPRYMPPEQARGSVVTAAGDQHAFCVSLREALEPHGGVPAWIAPILARGTDPDPARRFASMAALLAALARDPARRRRRAVIGLALVAAGLGAFAIGRLRGGDAVEPCTGADSEVATSWSPELRAHVVANLSGLAPLANAGQVARDLDAYAATWAGEHRRTCLAHERKELTVPLYEGRLRCLSRARAQLAAVGEVMAGVKSTSLAEALRAAKSLPDARSCVDDAGLAPPPEAVRERVREVGGRVERALVLAVARSEQAVAAAAQAATDARATGYAPLIARARLVEGRALVANRADAGQALSDAMTTALGVSDDVTAVEAYARWIFATETLDDDRWTVMVPIAERLGPPGRFARALMYNNRGVALMSKSDRAGAREMLERSRAAAGDAPEIELVSIRQNLAQVAPDLETAATLIRAAYDRLAAALGRDHYDVLIARVQVALTTRALSTARGELDEACRGLERWHSMATFAYCAYEAAWLADEADDQAAARAWFARVAGAQLVGPIADAYIALTTHSLDVAQALARLVASLVTAPVPVYAFDAYVVIAQIDPAAWPRALALLETLPYANYQRRIARARAAVAEQLVASQPDEARRLDALARAWFTREEPVRDSR